MVEYTKKKASKIASGALLWHVLEPVVHQMIKQCRCLHFSLCSDSCIELMLQEAARLLDIHATVGTERGPAEWMTTKLEPEQLSS